MTEPRCGCSNPGVIGCTCTLIDSDDVNVSGNGTVATPYSMAPILSGAANQLLSCGANGLLATVTDVVVSRKVQRTTGLSVVTATDTVLTFQSSVWESSPTPLTWSAVTNPGRSIIPASEDGLYAWAGWAGFTLTAQGLCRCTLRKTSGATVTHVNERGLIGTSGFPMLLIVSGVVEMVAGDYCELLVRQESGAGAATIGALAGARLTRG